MPVGRKGEVALSMVQVYTPESPVKHPVRLVADSLGELRTARTIAWRLAVRDISAQYRQTLLGYVWAILPAAIVALVWVALNHASIVKTASVVVPYPVFVLTGTIFWQLFMDSLNAPLQQLSGNRATLIRVRFPPEALLLSGVIQVVFSFLIKLVLLAAVIVAYGVAVKWTLVLVILPASGFVVVGTVAGMLLAPLGVLYKDVSQALFAIVMPLMLLTPVVYPTPSAGLLATIMRNNPLTPLFEVTRGMLFTGSFSDRVGGLGIVYGAAILLALLGWLAFRLAMPLLVERLEA